IAFCPCLFYAVILNAVKAPCIFLLSVISRLHSKKSAAEAAPFILPLIHAQLPFLPALQFHTCRASTASTEIAWSGSICRIRVINSSASSRVLNITRLYSCPARTWSHRHMVSVIASPSKLRLSSRSCCPALCSALLSSLVIQRPVQLSCRSSYTAALPDRFASLLLLPRDQTFQQHFSPTEISSPPFHASFCLNHSLTSLPRATVPTWEFLWGTILNPPSPTPWLSFRSPIACHSAAQRRNLLSDGPLLSSTHARSASAQS